MSSTPLVASGSAARFLIPTDGLLGSSWTDPAFDDGSWSGAGNGIGFSPAGDSPLPREVEPNGTIATANSAAFNFAPAGANLYQMGISGVASVTSSVINDDWFKIGKLDPGDVLSVAGAGGPGGRSG